MKPACDRVLDALGGPLDPELTAHVEECESCRALLDTHKRIGPSPTLRLPEARTEAIRRKLRDELSRPPGKPWWWHATLLVAINLLMALVAWRVDVHDKHPPYPLFAFLLKSSWLHVHPAKGSLIIGVGALLAALSVVGPLVALSPTTRRLKMTFVALLGSVLLVCLGWRWQARAHPNYLHDLRVCTLWEVLLSILPVVFGVWVLSRRAHDSLRSVVLIMSCATTGVYIMHQHCAVATPFHNIVFHVIPWLLISGAALAIRSRIRSRSHAP